MIKPTRVAIAMSGGVDSSVAAALLKAAGHEVFGLMLRLWSPSPTIQNRCCSPADLALAQQVAATLDIPFYTLDAKGLFKATVVDPFIDGYANGVTPNPCLNCNRKIRWGFLLDRALAMGASHMATGHYARLETQGNRFYLLRAKDRMKDQSYILSVLHQEQLAHALFPLGELQKSEVRQLASEYELPVADRGESQDLCFLGGMDYRTFLETQQANLPPPGPIMDSAGNRLGTHQGLASYTIGQRKGIRISAQEPYYVMQKDHLNNHLIVARRAELGRKEFWVEECNWIAGIPPQAETQATAKVRYKSAEIMSTLFPETNQRLRVQLHQSLPDITPGQAAVFYQEEYCLGGGIIST